MILQERMHKWQEEVKEYKDRQRIFPWTKVFEASQIISEMDTYIDELHTEITYLKEKILIMKGNHGN